MKIGSEWVISVLFLLVVFSIGVFWSGTEPVITGEVISKNILGGEVYYIEIENMAFNPEVLTINAGDLVFWTNLDSIGYSVLSEDGMVNSGSLGPGEKYSYRFDSSGNFSYSCSSHPEMIGKIIVKS